MSLSYPDTEAAPSLLKDQAPQEPKRPQDDERQALRDEYKRLMGQGGNGGPGGRRPSGRASWLYFLIVCALLAYLFMNLGGVFDAGKKSTELATSSFVTAVKQDRVKTVTYTVADGSVEGQYWKKKSEIGKASKLVTFTTHYVGSDSLAELMAKHPKTTYIVNTNNPDFWSDMLINALPSLMLIIIVIYFMRQMMGANNKNMQFGKTNAKTNESTRPKVKFSDVAGIDEAVEELEEIRDFLVEPERYRKLGAKIPRGVLLVGPPGTGKTLLAKAVAGEAGVPFFSISGSDFVEMFVGVGASRVRDLFKEAKAQAPSIIFIDEIDAVGRQRGAGLGGGHDEREQTLNQLLVEMDGFGSNEGVVVLAATNRVDILDPALLRPGRFDRQVYVGLPDIKGREEILKIHARNKPLAEDVDLGQVAKGTPGFTGADLENLLNEAALLTGRQDKAAIDKACIDEAVIKVIAGPEKHSRVIPQQERKLTAYHEAGHAVVMRALPQHDPVHQITIVPRGQAGGMTISLPDEDRSYLSREYMIQQIVSLLGGRAAEQLMLGDISTGASNDIQRATSLARRMVGTYGMSEKLGTVAFDTGSDEVFIGKSMGHTRPYSEKTAAEMDSEIRAIIDDAYQKAQDILKTYQRQLTDIAEYLLANETMTGEVFESFFTEKTSDAQ